MCRLPRIAATLSVIAVTLAAVVMLGNGASAAPLVNLGTAESSGVLAGTTVTNTGPSVILGDLGLSPGSAVTGFPPGVVIGGTIHAADAVALQAKTDLTSAYNVAAALPCGVELSGTDLGGLTLTPGVYCFSSSAFLTGDLTLDAQGDPDAEFVLQAVSTLITASSSRVLLINGTQACKVFAQVGSSATLGTNSQFVGTILALTSITATTGVSVQGRLLARNGAVTLDTNSITRPTCVSTTTSSAAPATTPTTIGSTATTLPATATTRVTVPLGTVPPGTVTATVTPAPVTPAPVTPATVPTSTRTTTPRSASGVTTTTAPDGGVSRRFAKTGRQLASPVAVGLLAIMVGAMILLAPRFRAGAAAGRSDSRV
jgi:type VI secretion system secreted protein VgrG